MREILFRGKRMSPYTKEWIEGSLIQVFAEGNVYTKIYTEDHVADPFEKYCWDIEPYERNLLDVYPDTVGQYTGLTDKNGKKIFEGDILRYGQRVDYACYLESIEHPEEYDGKIYDTGIEIDVVEWGIDMDYPAFDFKNHQFECNGLAQIMCGDYEYEVIGNIHDNPELLEVEE